LTLALAHGESRRKEGGLGKRVNGDRVLRLLKKQLSKYRSAGVSYLPRRQLRK
jgi:hypothetical protein